MNSSEAASQAAYAAASAGHHQHGYAPDLQQNGSARWLPAYNQQQQQQQQHPQQQHPPPQHERQVQILPPGQQPFSQHSAPVDVLRSGFTADFPQQGAPWPPMQQQQQQQQQQHNHLHQVLPMPFMGHPSDSSSTVGLLPNLSQTNAQQFHVGNMPQSHMPGQRPPPASDSALFDDQDQLDDSDLIDNGEQRDSASGPIRSKTFMAENRDKIGKGPIAAPVKAACTFCRSRKSRCDGKQPCATCVAREKVDDCVYTVSRRGGKPKPKRPVDPEVLQNHLRHLAMLSELPHTARIPDNGGHIPNIQDFSNIFPTGRPEHTISRPNGNSVSSASGSAHTSMDGSFNAIGPFPIAIPIAPGGILTSPTWAPMSAGSSAMSGTEFGSLYGMTGGPSQPNTTSLLPGSDVPSNGPGMGPQQTSAQPSGVTQPDWSDQGIITFTDTKTLLEDYYKYLHRFIPVLPSPIYLDALTSSWNPQSPFLLALQALLPLLRDEIQPVNSMHGRGLNFGNAAKKEQVRRVTTHFEKLANEAVDRAVENADGDAKEKVALEVIQALCVLTIFDYGSGRAVKARLKADQALGLAMAEGLHRLRSSASTQGHAVSSDFFGRARLPESEVFEMKKRCWWTVWSLILWAAYNTGNTSTLRADDPRVTCEMPYSTDPTAWIANMRSLQLLLTVQERVIALTDLNSLKEEDKEGASPYAVASPMSTRTVTTPVSLHSFGNGSTMAGQSSSSAAATEGSRNALFSSMLELDHQLEDQIEMQESQLSAVRNGRHVETFAGLPSSLDSAEDAMIAYLHTSAAIQLYTSSLTLHIGQAFQGASLFERKLCFLNPNKGNSGNSPAQACRDPMTSNHLGEFAQAAGGLDAPIASGPDVAGGSALADIFNPFSWMTQNMGMVDPAQQSHFGLGGAQVQPVFGQQHSDAAGKAGSESGTQPGGRKARKDLFAQGPFSAQHSLGRCVRASIRLLEIASNKRLEPNPFNACSFVLISYVLLMLAMSRSIGSEDNDDEDGDEDDIEDMSNQEQLLQLAGLSSDGTLSAQSLQQIWNRVQQARDSLAALSEIWDMVIPMVWEITSCLETSRTLFSQEQQA